MTVTEITCPRCGESLLTAIHVVDGCVVGSVYEQVVGVIGDVSGLTAEECDEIARALDQAGLLAPAPLQEQWGYRLHNGRVWGKRSRVEVERTANGLPIVHRFVTDWEEA